MSTNAAAIMLRYVVWKRTEERKERRRNGKRGIPLDGVNPSIRAAKNIAFSSIAMAAQRDEQCIGILFSFHFLSFITIDVLEPGTDLVKRIYSPLDGTRAAFIFAEYLFFYHYRSHLITRVNERNSIQTREI